MVSSDSIVLTTRDDSEASLQLLLVRCSRVLTGIEIRRMLGLRENRA
jgi:hypothetical protein